MNKEWKITSKKKTIKNKDALKDIVIAKDDDFYFYLPEHVESLRKEIIEVLELDLLDNELERAIINIINSKFGVVEDDEV